MGDGTMEQLAAAPQIILDRGEYHRWAANQLRGRHERVAGTVVAMAPERAAHIRVKARVWQALDRSIRAAGLPCEVFADGMTVEIGDDTDYEPDAVVNCSERISGNAIAAPNPVIVVEVLSPSTRSIDTGAKLADYLSLPSVRHYLIVRADRRAVIQHQRNDDGIIETRIISTGVVTLDPPGVRIGIEDLYAP